MIKYRPALFIVMVASLVSKASFAQEDRGTAEERAACTPDAFRLCSSYIPDASAVEACLRLRKSNLSEGCKAVFDHGTTGSGRNR